MLGAISRTLTARKDDIAGLAVASDERIEAYILYMTRGAEEISAEIVSLRSFIDDGGARLKKLLADSTHGGSGLAGFRKFTRRRSPGTFWRRSVSSRPAAIGLHRAGTIRLGLRLPELRNGVG